MSPMAQARTYVRKSYALQTCVSATPNHGASYCLEDFVRPARHHNYNAAAMDLVDGGGAAVANNH